MRAAKLRVERRRVLVGGILPLLVACQSPPRKGQDAAGSQPADGGAEPVLSCGDLEAKMKSIRPYIVACTGTGEATLWIWMESTSDGHLNAYAVQGFEDDEQRVFPESKLYCFYRSLIGRRYVPHINCRFLF